MQKLARKFIPATDEVWRLQNRSDLECRFFQGFSEGGHYGGRSRPTSTRQGIYCCTPAGRFLGSINTSRPAAMANMLKAALAKWRAIPQEKRLLAYDPATRVAQIQRAERRYPKDGLAVRVYSRDLARPGRPAPNDWRGRAWNVDSLWFHQAEAARLLPADPKAGASHAWPAALAQRLVCRNLVDNVRGQTNGYRRPRVAEITTTVTAVRGSIVHLTLRGRSEASTTGRWPTDGDVADMQRGDPWARGVRTTMYGEAEYDRKAGRFVRFELVAAGTRWGRTRYNFRQDDDREAPIAFAIVLDPKDLSRRVAPAELGAYGW